MVKITMNNLVVPKNPQSNWRIGKVIGMSHFGLSIGPLFKIRDIISGDLVKRFSMHIDKLIIAK